METASLPDTVFMSVFSRMLPRSGVLSLKRGLNPRLIILFKVDLIVVSILLEMVDRKQRRQVTANEQLE